MKTVVLVGCGKAKLGRPAKAKDLYTGSLFRKGRAYAERFGDEWGILSAKHDLLMPDDVVEPYDLALRDLGHSEFVTWIRKANEALSWRWPEAEFVCLAGELYSRAFEFPTKLEVRFPLAGLGLGKRLHCLNDALKAGRPLRDRMPLERADVHEFLLTGPGLGVHSSGHLKRRKK